ncbi:MAG: PAS domain-containing protein [Thermoflexibacter sp.]|jgi:two-component system CheB/CheR fusion protein|nr:PAS domain-containing protein [Thermoflexibacter sp.]
MINLFKTKKIKEAIDSNPTNVQEIINASEYAICITNAEGLFAFVNDNYCQTYGYSREELIGNHFSMVVPDNTKAILNKLHDEYIEKQQEISNTWEVVNKKGELMKINVDARFTDKIGNQPHKITYVERMN